MKKEKTNHLYAFKNQSLEVSIHEYSRSYLFQDDYGGCSSVISTWSSYAAPVWWSATPNANTMGCGFNRTIFVHLGWWFIKYRAERQQWLCCVNIYTNFKKEPVKHRKLRCFMQNRKEIYRMWSCCQKRSVLTKAIGGSSRVLLGYFGDLNCMGKLHGSILYKVRVIMTS